MHDLATLTTSAVSVADSLKARASLIWIADRWHDLKARLIPAPTPRTGNTGGRPAPRSRPPLDLEVSSLLHEIEVEARMLAHVLLDEVDGWRPSTSAMPGLLRDVAEEHGHWTTQDDATALRFVKWADEYRARVERTFDRPAHPAYIGPCRYCDADLYLRHETNQAECRGCGATVNIEKQVDWIRAQLEARLMTLGEIRAALVILDCARPIGTLKTWAHKGKLTRDESGLYHLSDALRLARKAATRQRLRKS